MRFDIIVGNPPYHETTGGGACVESKTSLYDKFINKSLELCNKYVLMIIPSRWLTGGNTVLSDFRTSIVDTKTIKMICNFGNSKEIFGDAEIGGGVQFLLLDKHHNSFDVTVRQCNNKNGTTEVENESIRNLSKYKYIDARGITEYMIIVDSKALSIIEKVLSKNETTYDSVMTTTYPFGIGCEFKSRDKEQDGDVRIVYSMGKYGYTSKNDIKKNLSEINKYNIVTGKMSPDRGGLRDTTKSLVINKPKILKPNEICTGTYIMIDSSDNEEVVNNINSYLKCKFTRFLINCTITSVNINRKNFLFVPVQDYSIEWTDEMLYKKYGLNWQEIKYIEDTIKKIN